MFMTPSLRTALAQQQGNKAAPPTTGATPSPGPTVAMAPQQPPKVFDQFGAAPSPGPSASLSPNFLDKARNVFGAVRNQGPSADMGGLRGALLQARSRFPRAFGRRGY